MEKLIVLYTMEGCPYCTEMKELLTKENISYISRDVDEYSDEYDMFMEAIDGNDFLPAFMVIEQTDKDYNVSFFAPERDYEMVSEAVEIIKNLV